MPTQQSALETHKGNTHTEDTFSGPNVTEKLNKQGFNFDKAQELFHDEPVENTPFRIIGKFGETTQETQGQRKEDWFISWNNHRLTGYLNTKQECQELIDTYNWHLIGIWMGAIIETYSQFLQDKLSKNNQ